MVESGAMVCAGLMGDRRWQGEEQCRGRSLGAEGVYSAARPPKERVRERSVARAARAPQRGGPLSGSPRSLAAACAHVPAPRRLGRSSHALPAILPVAVAASLAPQRAVLASAA
jgi:hypothetical protein